jgi:hypothetical protein
VLKPALVSIASFAVATAAMAHPGHSQGGDPFSLHHYLTEPVHVLGGMALLLGAALAVAGPRHRARAAIARAVSRVRERAS